MLPDVRARAVPMLLWVAIGTFAAGALVTVLVGVRTAMVAGPAVGGPFVLAPALVVAAAYGALAVGLYRGGRVARALAAVVSPALLVLALGSGGTAWWVLIGCVTTAAAALPVLAPSACAFLLGPWGRPSTVAVSVAVARSLATVAGVVSVVAALIALVVGLVVAGSGSAMAENTVSLVPGAVATLGVLVLALAVVSGGLGAFWLWAARALARGARGARIAVTVVGGISALPLVLGVADAPGPALASLVLHAALIGALWVPNDARLHFGDHPLAVVERVIAAGGPFTTTSTDGTPTPPGGSPTLAPPAPSSPPTGVRSPEPSTPAAGIGRSEPSTGFSLLELRPDTAPFERPRDVGSVPIPAPRSEADPLTEPIALGRHHRRAPQAPRA